MPVTYFFSSVVIYVQLVNPVLTCQLRFLCSHQSESAMHAFSFSVTIPTFHGVKGDAETDFWFLCISKVSLSQAQN